MRPTKDEYFAAMLGLVASRSTCARRQVGAIITTEDGRVLSTGYNGVPHNFTHCIDTPCGGESEPSGTSGFAESQCLAVHAEQNALLQCWRLDLAHTLYVTCEPCFACAKMIANTSIKRIVCLQVYPDPLAESVLRRAGVTVYRFHDAYQQTYEHASKVNEW